MQFPIPGARVSQKFGENATYYAKFGLKGHNGIDLAAPKPEDYFDWHGVPVLSVSDGVATVVTNDPGYGIYVYVRSADNDWLYAHLAEALVANGQYVRDGEILGLVGYTGNVIPPGVRGTHLHWAKRPNAPYHLDNGMRGYVDPMQE